MGYFQKSGLAPTQLQRRLIHVVFLSASEETVWTHSIISASFSKASLKDKQAETQGSYLPKVTKLLEEGYKIPPDSKAHILLCCVIPLLMQTTNYAPESYSRVRLCTWHVGVRGPSGSGRQWHLSCGLYWLNRLQKTAEAFRCWSVPWLEGTEGLPLAPLLPAPWLDCSGFNIYSLPVCSACTIQLPLHAMYLGLPRTRPWCRNTECHQLGGWQEWGQVLDLVKSQETTWELGRRPRPGPSHVHRVSRVRRLRMVRAWGRMGT